MPVQQGLLESTNTNIDFENINSELEHKADRILHNGTDLLKAEFQTLRPTQGYHFLTDSTPSGVFQDPVQVPSYIDRNTSTGAGGAGGYHFAVEYPTTIKTNQIKLFSTTFLNVTPGAGTHSVKVMKDFGTVATQASLLPVPVDVSYVFRNDLSPQQFEYTLDFQEVEGRSWFVTFVVSGADTTEYFDGVTEITIKEVPHPQIAYFRVDGTEASRHSMEEDNLLDITYNKTTSKYYTARFNDTGVGGAALGPDDDFTTVSGETSFNPIRWTEHPIDSTFIRSISNSNLLFTTTAGTGRLTSNYVVSGNYTAELDFDINTLNDPSSFFGMHSLNGDTGRLKYGIGVTARGGNSFYKAAIKNFSNNTSSAELLDLYPDLENVYEGSETWTLTYIVASGHWSVEGSQTGSRAAAQTGEMYTASGISFQISANTEQNNNDSFTFDIDYERTGRTATSGTLNIQRSGSNYTSTQSGGFNETISSEDDKIELFGITDASINVTGDNFTLTPSGSAIYPSIPVFTIEEVDAQGSIVQTIVEKLNVIKDPTKTYNDYIDGGVQLTASNTLLYVKVLNDIYTFSPASPIAGLVDEDTVGVERSQDVIESNKVYSFSYNDTEGGFLAYVYFDEPTDMLQVKTLTSSTTPTPQTKKVFLDLPDWEEQADLGRPYQLYWLSDDNDSLFYIRRHGLGEVNDVKIESTTGVANGTTLFTDSSQNFVSAGVKEGDLVIIDENGYTDNGTYTVVQVTSTTSLILNETLEADTNIDYEIASDGELLSFNTDADQSAFAAVNVDDFTLRAGTSDTSEVTAEVINAWGEALSGKTVNFSVIQGDGAVAPPSDVTDGNGEANTQYTAGSTPGAVTIKASITEI